jgi:hypothetical protein
MLKRKKFLLFIVTLIICIVLIGCTQNTDIPTNNTPQVEDSKGLTSEEISELEEVYLPFFYEQYQVRKSDNSNDIDYFVYNTINFDYTQNKLYDIEGYVYSNSISMNKMREILKETTGSEESEFTKDILGETYTAEVLDKHWGYLAKITDMVIDGENYNIKFDTWYFSEDGTTVENVETGELIDITYDGSVTEEELAKFDFDDYLNYIEENVTPVHSSIVLKKNLDYKYSKYQMVEE